MNNDIHIYFGHHKCATAWINSILRSVCKKIGCKYLDINSLNVTSKVDLKTNIFFYDTNCISTNSELYINSNYKGFHVIRDPRDIVVSAYFSHKKTHPIGDWLAEHRKKLNSVSFEEGIRLEMDKRIGEFNAMRN